MSRSPFGGNHYHFLPTKFFWIYCYFRELRLVPIAPHGNAAKCGIVGTRSNTSNSLFQEKFKRLGVRIRFLSDDTRFHPGVGDGFEIEKVVFVVRLFMIRKLLRIENGFGSELLKRV